VFLGAPYTESLFLLTTGLSLEFVRKKRWWAAGLAGMMAALTRNLGVLTALAFVTGYLMDYREKVVGGQAKWKDLPRNIILKGGLWCALIPMGTVIYLIINVVVYGDPLIFLTIQKQHWSQSFGFFANTVVTSLRYALNYKEWLYRLYLFIPQTVAIAISLITLPWLLKKMTAAEAVYSLAYVICIMSPTWLLSYPRYLMGLVTLYPAMARMIRPTWARLACTAIFLFLMISFTFAYVRGWPVL
jgi:hypothetical protein